MAQAPQPSWHPEDIRAAVRKRTGTISVLAERSGYTVSALCKVIRGCFMPGPAEAISRAIEIHPSVLWPQWFHPDGTPRQGRGAITDRAKDSASRRRRNVQTRSAA